MEQLICRSVIIMSEDWKNKDIPPYLKGKPANWSDKENDWNAFKGNEKLEKELASIKQTQTEILERLDKPIDTQVTGSNVGYSDDEKPSGNKGDSFLELDTLDVYMNDGSEWVKL